MKTNRPPADKKVYFLEIFNVLEDYLKQISLCDKCKGKVTEAIDQLDQSEEDRIKDEIRGEGGREGSSRVQSDIPKDNKMSEMQEKFYKHIEVAREDNTVY